MWANNAIWLVIDWMTSFDFTVFQHIVLFLKNWNLFWIVMLCVLRGWFYKASFSSRFQCGELAVILMLISKIHRPPERVSLPLNDDWLFYFSRLIYVFGYQPLFLLLLKFICHFLFLFWYLWTIFDSLQLSLNFPVIKHHTPDILLRIIDHFLLLCVAIRPTT